MANTKITELTAVTALAGTDVFPVVDVSADTTNKVSVEDLLRNAPDGAEGAPSIANAGDQDTGIYFPAANSVGVSTDGTQRLVIDSAGRVGIGSSSPAANLHITGSSETIVRVTSADGGGAFLDLGDVSDPDGGRIVYDSGSNLTFSTASSERLRIDSAGRVGIGTSSPSAPLAFGKTVYGEPTSEDFYRIKFKDFGGTNNDVGIGQPNEHSLAFNIEGGSTASCRWIAGVAGERMRLDGSGRLLVGKSTSQSILGFEAGTQFATTAGTTSFVCNTADTGAPEFISAKSRGTSDSPAIVQNNDGLWLGRFAGYDGSSYVEAARISAIVNGTPGTNDMPGALLFSTTADGASSPTEHFRIASNGDLTATDTTIGSNSDSRLKTNITDFAYDLETFKQYQPKTFDWKNPELHGNKTSQRGFIAQDVEAIDDYWVSQQAVNEDSADAEFLDADRLAKTLKLDKKDAMYVSVIQQLLAKVETLEAKVAALEAE